MKIKCLMTFLDGAERFEKDDSRTVEDSRGARFVANGWAEDESGHVATGEVTTGETDLSINNVIQGQELTHG